MHWACLLAYATPKSHSRTPVAKRISGGGEHSCRTVRTGVSKHLATRHELFPRTARAQRIARSRKGIHSVRLAVKWVSRLGFPPAKGGSQIPSFEWFIRGFLEEDARQGYVVPRGEAN